MHSEHATNSRGTEVFRSARQICHLVALEDGDGESHVAPIVRPCAIGTRAPAQRAAPPAAADI